MVHRVWCQEHGLLSQRGVEVDTLAQQCVAAPAHGRVAVIEWNSVLNRLMREPVCKLMRRRGTSEADAEELIQEAWVRSLEYSRENEVRSMEAFIERTANNLAIDRYRHRKRYQRENEDIRSLEQRMPVVSSVRNPHEVWIAVQRLNEIRDALNELLEGTGDIFVLHRAGFGYKELAAVFKLSESTIEKRIARAMLWLMEQEEYG